MKFLYTLQFDLDLLAHTTNRDRAPKIFRVNIYNSAEVLEPITLGLLEITS